MEKQRLLIIGARGFLGTHTVHAAETTDRLQVIRGDRNGTNDTGSVAIDIADASSVKRAFEFSRPDAVILLAALSDIDKCEANPTDAYATNAYGVEHVANACAQSGARFLFTSSAAVFDGKKHGYSEVDPVSPLSVYGETKAWAEKAVHSLTPSAVVIRFGLVIGAAHRSGTNAMLDRLVAKWKAGEVVAFPEREMRNPIDAPTLAKLMAKMVSDESVSGMYHAGALDSLSRYELGRRLAIRSGFSADLVKQNDTQVPGRAQRGEDHFLLTDKIRTLYSDDIQLSDQVIERCFDDSAKGN